LEELGASLADDLLLEALLEPEPFNSLRLKSRFEGIKGGFIVVVVRGVFAGVLVTGPVGTFTFKVFLGL
jgi:hypothetical protein